MEQKEQMTNRQKMGYLLSEIDKHGIIEESELQSVRDHDYNWRDYNGRIGSDVSFIGELVAPNVRHNDGRSWESYDLSCKGEKLGRIVAEEHQVALVEDSEADAWRDLIPSYPKPLKKVGRIANVTLISPAFEKSTGHVFAKEYKHSTNDGMAGIINHLQVLCGRDETADAVIDHMYNAVVRSIAQEKSLNKKSKFTLNNAAEQNKPNDNDRAM